VAIDAAGNAMVVWIQHNGQLNYTIMAARFNTSSGEWDARRAIQADRYNSYFPKVTIDPAGNAIAVWLQSNGKGKTTVHAARYAAREDKWGAPKMIQDGSHGSISPVVAVSASGSAISMWAQRVFGNYYVAVNRLAP
jgi:hypothetical protein